jgi:hypothetical protein
MYYLIDATSHGAARVGTFTLFGYHIGVIQLMVAAMVIMIVGVLLYRLGTRNKRFMSPR